MGKCNQCGKELTTDEFQVNMCFGCGFKLNDNLASTTTQANTMSKGINIGDKKNGKIHKIILEYYQNNNIIEKLTKIFAFTILIVGIISGIVMGNTYDSFIIELFKPYTELFKTYTELPKIYTEFNWTLCNAIWALTLPSFIFFLVLSEIIKQLNKIANK